MTRQEHLASILQGQLTAQILLRLIAALVILKKSLRKRMKRKTQCTRNQLQLSLCRLDLFEVC